MTFLIELSCFFYIFRSRKNKILFKPYSRCIMFSLFISTYHLSFTLNAFPSLHWVCFDHPSVASRLFEFNHYPSCPFESNYMIACPIPLSDEIKEGDSFVPSRGYFFVTPQKKPNKDWKRKENPSKNDPKSPRTKMRRTLSLFIVRWISLCPWKNESLEK